MGTSCSHFSGTNFVLNLLLRSIIRVCFSYILKHNVHAIIAELLTPLLKTMNYMWGCSHYCRTFTIQNSKWQFVLLSLPRISNRSCLLFVKWLQQFFFQLEKVQVEEKERDVVCLKFFAIRFWCSCTNRVIMMLYINNSILCFGIGFWCCVPINRFCVLEFYFEAVYQ